MKISSKLSRKYLIAASLVSAGLFCTAEEKEVTHNPSRLILDMVHPNPGTYTFGSRFEHPQVLKDWGYNGAVPHGHVQTLVTFDTFDDTTFPKGSEERQWVEEMSKKFEERIKAANKAGIKFYPFTDFIVLPKSLVKKYESEITRPGKRGKGKKGHGAIDIHRPKTKEIMRALITSIFERFPDLGGLTLRHGETYLHGLPHHTGGNPILDGPASHIELMNLLRDEICVKRNKVLIYRTWDFGDQFHNNPSYYTKVSEGVEPHKNLFISIKQQRGDFHRMSFFNPTIGQGRHQQIVEVQCQMEAYGKGAHPYYIGQGAIDGWEEYDITMKNMPGKPRGLRDIVNLPIYSGTWTWTRGGGWGGPFLKNEFWCGMNAYIVSKWAQDPTRTEEEVFNEFASEEAGIKDNKNLEIFRKIALLSAAGVLRGHTSTICSVDPWWIRDDKIGDPRRGGGLSKIIAKGLTEEILKEKAESVKTWKEIEKLSCELQVPDEALAEFIRSSSTYGRIKYEIVEQLWTTLLLGMKGDKSKKYETARIKKAITRYDELWEEWRALEKSSPSCSTLYNDKKIQGTLKKYRSLK